MTWVAYADESMRQRMDSLGVYVMAAVVCEKAGIGTLRDEATKLARGSLPFHWHEAGPRVRSRAVEMIATLDCLQYVVVGTGLDNARQERHRRKCLERLLWGLEQFGVTTVVLDSRRGRQDERDRRAIQGWRSRAVVSAALRVDFARGADDQLIWLADAVAGASVLAWGGEDDRYLKPLDAQIEKVVFELS